MRDCPGRIVHCVRSDSFAGVERYVASVATELSSRGWEVTVVGGDRRRMQSELGPVVHVPASTTFAVVDRLLHCDRNTIVHAHMTAAEAAATSASMLRRFPLVATRHFAAPRGSTKVGRLAGRLIRHAVDRQISISHFVADAIGEPSIVILNGVPLNDSRPAPEMIVLTAQRLEREKHTETAIEAWAHSTLRNAGWRLTIAGSGQQEVELAQLVDALSLRDSVDFVGQQSDMTSLMRRAAIFLAPAPTEPFGLSVAEAMAAAVPVVAARGGAHVETIGAVADRYLFPVDDAKAAAAMLDSLGADPEARARLGSALQAWQRQHLSIASHVDRLEQVYAELRR